MPLALLMARPGQTTGPLFRAEGKVAEMECMRAFREEWGSCLEDGFEGLGEGRKQALKEALKKEWISSPVYKLPERKVKKQRLLSSDDWNAIAAAFVVDGP